MESLCGFRNSSTCFLCSLFIADCLPRNCWSFCLLGLFRVDFLLSMQCYRFNSKYSLDYLSLLSLLYLQYNLLRSNWILMFLLRSLFYYFATLLIWPCKTVSYQILCFMVGPSISSLLFLLLFQTQVTHSCHLSYSYLLFTRPALALLLPI